MTDEAHWLCVYVQDMMFYPYASPEIQKMVVTMVEQRQAGERTCGCCHEQTARLTPYLMTDEAAIDMMQWLPLLRRLLTVLSISNTHFMDSSNCV
jgi:hypothetical protein